MFIVFISFRCQFGAPEVFFPWAPACAWNYMAPLLSCWLNLICFFLAPSFFHFFFLFPFFSCNLFHSFSLSVSFPFLFSFFLEPLWWPRRAWAPKAPQDTPLLLCSLYPPVSFCLLFFFLFVLSSRKFQPILQKVESRGRCCLLTFLLYFFDFLLVKHPPMPCRLILCVSKTVFFFFHFYCPVLGTGGGKLSSRTLPRYEVGRGAANTEWRHIQGAPNRQRKGKTNI